MLQSTWGQLRWYLDGNNLLSNIIQIISLYLCLKNSLSKSLKTTIEQKKFFIEKSHVFSKVHHIFSKLRQNLVKNHLLCTNQRKF